MLVVGAGTARAALAAPPPELEHPEQSASGALLVRFVGSPVQARHELELRAESSDTALQRYDGPGPSAYLSGLEVGAYSLRARVHDETGWSEWSAPSALRVEAPSHARVWASLVVGASTFLATLGLIVFGVRRTRSRELGLQSGDDAA